MVNVADKPYTPPLAKPTIKLNVLSNKGRALDAEKKKDIRQLVISLSFYFY